MLAPIQHQGLRICLGAFRTSPAEAVCVEASEIPHNIRYSYLTLQYTLKLRSNPDNPTYDCVVSPQLRSCIRKETRQLSPFGHPYERNHGGCIAQLTIYSQHWCSQLSPLALHPSPLLKHRLQNSGKTLPTKLSSNKFLEMKHKYRNHHRFTLTDQNVKGKWPPQLQ
jgi:hypothetical protein